MPLGPRRGSGAASARMPPADLATLSSLQLPMIATFATGQRPERLCPPQGPTAAAGRRAPGAGNHRGARREHLALPLRNAMARRSIHGAKLTVHKAGG